MMCQLIGPLVQFLIGQPASSLTAISCFVTRGESGIGYHGYRIRVLQGVGLEKFMDSTVSFLLSLNVRRMYCKEFPVFLKENIEVVQYRGALANLLRNTL